MTLKRALFAASFASIFATAFVVMFVLGVTSDDRAWWKEWERGERFVAKQLAVLWQNPSARDQLVRDAARDLEVQIELRDASGRTLLFAGLPGRCLPGAFRVVVKDDASGVMLGDVRACRPGERSPPWRGFLAVFAAVAALWALATLVSRRAARPIQSLVAVARKIGGGDFSARPSPLGKRAIVEVKELSDAIGDMAERIEQQMKDQRALLAGASHELRTPLGHLRILVELVRAHVAAGGPGGKVVDDIEREVVDMDALVGKLLASSRLDFSLAEKRDVDAADIARRALERAGDDVAKLTVGAGSTVIRGDPTLLLGALTNVLENARTHGQGVVRVTIEPRADEVLFVVDDRGPGIPADEEEKVFEPFFHKVRDNGAAAGAVGAPQQGTLGLGLALVRRIAEAHGGRAFATTRPRVDVAGTEGDAGDVGGGRVGFTVARLPS